MYLFDLHAIELLNFGILIQVAGSLGWGGNH